MIDAPNDRPPVKASELPSGWKPGDSPVILDDDDIQLPPELQPRAGAK